MKAIRFCWLLTLLVAVSAHAETYTTNYVSGVTSNADTVVVGDTGPFNYLEINTAGVLSNTTSTVGNQSGADDNSVLVTGPGSRWDNAGTLTIGSAGNYNQLTVSN